MKGTEKGCQEEKSWGNGMIPVKTRHQECLTAGGRSAKKHTKKWPPDLSFAKCLGIL